MATGKFRLYFTHEHTQHAAAGVQYRLTNQESGQYFSFGTTDAHGETKPVEATPEVSTCTLEVLNAMTGAYESPDLDGTIGASPCPTMKLAGVEGKEVERVDVRVHGRERGLLPLAQVLSHGRLVQLPGLHQAKAQVAHHPQR